MLGDFVLEVNKTQKIFGRYISILKWLQGYTVTNLVADFIAGITVGLTMIPQSIAYAALAGIPTQYGLYTAFVGSFTYVFFGSIKEVSIGPTSLMALLTYTYVRGLPIEYVILLTFVVGCIELLMGVFKLGFLVDFISPCVTSAFTSATSLVIISTQLKGFFGIRVESHSFLPILYEVFSKVGQIKTADTALSCICMAALYGLKHVTMIRCVYTPVKKIMWLISISKNIIVVLISSIVAFYFYEYNGGSPVLLTGNVTSGLPTIKPPPFSATYANKTMGFLDMIEELGSGIIVIPFVAVLANIAIAKCFASHIVIDASQEMITLGLCNIFGSFVQAMPSCGAFTRSAVASNSGVKTPLQGLYSGAIIILALSFLTPYFFYIPKATLSAILIFAVGTLIDYEIYPKLWRVNKFDFWISVSTLIAGLAFSADIGIIIGSLLNLLVILRHWARPNIKCDIICDETYGTCIYMKPDCGLYYPAVDYLLQKTQKFHMQSKYLPIILDCSNIFHIDYAGTQAISTLVKKYNKESARFLLSNIHPTVFHCLQQVINLDDLHFCQCSEQPQHTLLETENVDDNGSK